MEGWDPLRWSVLDALRVSLVLARPDLDAPGGPAAVLEVFRLGDVGEQCALARSLQFLPRAEDYVWQAGECCRSNMTEVFTAMACDNAFPVRWFDDVAWRALVVKAIFVGAPLASVYGLDERLSEDLARMALDLADERRSAGREVQPTLWLCLGHFGGERALASLERELAGGPPRAGAPRPWRSDAPARARPSSGTSRASRTPRCWPPCAPRSTRRRPRPRSSPSSPRPERRAGRLLAAMKFFDPHIHLTSRTTDDLAAMAAAGIRAVVEPAFWIGQPRTNVGSFVDYFASLIGWERFRASQFGIAHYCAIGLNSKEANNEALAEQVLELVPRYALKEGVVAIGEIGFDEITAAEERAYRVQLQLAVDHEMVVMIHSPHRDKKRGVQLSIDIAREMGLPMERLVVDHNNEETVRDTLESGAWAGFTIYPHTKMDSARMVEVVRQYGPERIIVDSSADWGISDPLAVPRTAALMRERGLDEEAIRLTTWQNALDAYAQSGQIDVDALAGDAVIDQTQTFLDNSVLRGQEPQRTTTGA
ncbi:MAG: EboA domain-containing protein [Planctomycetes bacterium]|nr:EboA domain-containing protein [Planctomycetota bacterium]